jgi:esterase/lipase
MLLRLFFSLALLLIISTVQAENNVVYKLSSGIEAVARYTPGEKQKPVILALHGFLTTNNFNTILSLDQMLQENGFSVLAPNLTLGINRRDSGFACKAIHTNTMDDDVNEISDWVSWLVKKGHKDIILLGHSQGSMKLLAYISERKIPKEVRLVIATSLSYIDAFISDKEKQKNIAQAQKALKHKLSQPGTYSLAYCKDDYIAPAEIYLSWTRWDEKQIITSINQSHIPVFIIMGGRDRYFNTAWVAQLKKSKASVKLIKQARHFFDGSEEFDYHDSILNILEETHY